MDDEYEDICDRCGVNIDDHTEESAAECMTIFLNEMVTDKVESLI